MKSRHIAFLFLLAGLVLPTISSAADVTLLMVPREDVPVRVGMDVGNRHPTLLLSYKVLPNGVVSIHGWNGSEWVNISEDAFTNGTFFPKAPADALIVVGEGENIPPALVPSAAWCPAVYRISTIQTRPLLHLVGRHYDFKYKDWKWFAENYHLSINEINPDRLNISWYHQRLGENLNKKNAGDSDLQYLSVVRSQTLAVDPPPDSVQEQEMDDEQEVVSEDTPVDELADNPLTNAAPEAVVLGAGDADAADDADAPAATESESTMDAKE